MKSIIIAVILTALLCGVSASPTIIIKNEARATDTNYRLQSSIYPSAYRIHIVPYFDTGDESTAFTFDGEVKITVQSKAVGSKQIKLHSAELHFTADDVSVVSTTGSNVPVTSIEFDEDYTFVYINLETELLSTLSYDVTIKYVGNIRNDTRGFYRSWYNEGGVKKWLGATQMQPTHARKVFPCFDEPEYKATFTFVIDRLESYEQSLTNGKLESTEILENGRIREIFYPSPNMSTYLVAILVSEFEAGEYSVDENGKEFGIWSRPEAKNQSSYAYEVGKKILDDLKEFTGIDYYSSDQYLKLDHVAIPDKSGAMENWGLIKYGESSLMYDPQESSVIHKQQIATIVAHETAHLWFGDLVTCNWWSVTWLNEGFATYFENVIAASAVPSLGLDDQFISRHLSRGFIVDETANVAAMNDENVNSPEEVSAHFGQVSYSKAGSVIMMIQHWIGLDAFKYGLNQYLVDNGFGTVLPSNLYAGLQSGADFYNSLQAYPGYDVAKVMDTWASTPGYPVLDVVVDFSTKNITITQERFYTDPEESSEDRYLIPISFTTEDETDFENTKPSFIFEGKTYSFVHENLTHGWVIFNIQQTGYYRVNYDDHMWEHIRDALKSSDRTKIHRLNRAQIVGDLFALAKSDKLTYERAFDVLNFLSQETEYAPWTAAISGFTSLRSWLAYTPEKLATLDKYILNLLPAVIEKLGFEDIEGEDDLTKRHRMQILDFACKLGHKDCVENAVEVFEEFKVHNATVHPNLRPVVYCTALKQGNAEDFEALWKRYIVTNVENDRAIIYNALGCTSSTEKVLEFLHLLITPEYEIRGIDASNWFSSALNNANNIETVVDFVLENSEQLNRVLSWPTALNLIVAALSTDEDLTKIENWLEACSSCSNEDKQTVFTAIGSKRGTFKWSELHVNDIIAVGMLEAAESSSSVITSSLITLSMSLYFKLISNYF